MVDKIVTLENNKKYVILEESVLDGIRYYFGLGLNEKEEPTNKYLFFEESISEGMTYLLPIDDEELKGVLLTSFTTNYLDKVYDNI